MMLSPPPLIGGGVFYGLRRLNLLCGASILTAFRSFLIWVNEYAGAVWPQVKLYWLRSTRWPGSIDSFLNYWDCSQGIWEIILTHFWKYWECGQVSEDNTLTVFSAFSIWVNHLYNWRGFWYRLILKSTDRIWNKWREITPIFQLMFYFLK